METVLITGGDGFIGRFVADELLARGNKVRVLDSLIEQVHGDVERPPLLNDEVELIRGDVFFWQSLQAAGILVAGGGVATWSVESSWLW